ncbi:portal protein [Microbacterium phage NarutoRun]|uniref:Portal protein n=2 Tax=Krampusvirus krampus TaxID=2734242 RepID=A0A4Y6EJ91_9CAUD|nr:portal protein [Microbacterium phage Anakin]QDF18147.1 portal protein [Microbacterium phage NarutoRun]
MADLQTPYSTAMPYVVADAASGGWQSDYDRQRLSSYDLYDDMFHNDPARYRLMLRGSDEKPIYVPTAGSIIKSLARYVGKNWGFRVMEPVADPGEEAPEVTPEQIALAQVTFGKLFARERLLSRYRSGVPEWLRRGDWCWFVSADELKAPGRRISVRPIDPRRYFPINGDVTDLSRVTGQQLIEEVMVGDTIALYVQTWLKASDPGHPDFGQIEPEEGFPITYSADVFDVKDYDDPLKRKRLTSQEYASVPQEYIEGITQLPIYHIKNNEETDDPFGRSDLAGLESMVSGINQAITDEDLALALMGIGMYTTDSGAPVDETTGQPTNWKLGPNRVVETDEGTSFSKVDGIDDVKPFQDHVGYMKSEAQGNAGLSDVSVGTAQNVSAESGIALAIKFSPTQDTVIAKNDNSNGVLSQMLHDLKDWFLAFEQIDLGDVDIVSVTEDKNLLPFDREGRWKELMEGVTAKLFTIEYAVQVAADEFGYVFPAGYGAAAQAASDAAAAALDPFAARAGAEQEAADAEEDEAGDESAAES